MVGLGFQKPSHIQFSGGSGLTENPWLGRTKKDGTGAFLLSPWPRGEPPSNDNLIFVLLQPHWQPEARMARGQ
jgi:hypothetical protein